MDQKIKDALTKFLDKNAALVNNNEFERLYFRLATSTDDVEYVPSLTQLLYEAGIDPLEYMDVIPTYCFAAYPIKTFTVPSHIKKIESGAFQGCLLETIYIPDSVTKIEGSAFGLCMRLQEIKLPNGLNTIETDTFYSCIKLKKVTIPPSVKTIEVGAFSECASLDTIVFEGTKHQWTEIDIQWPEEDEQEDFYQEVYDCTIKCTDGVMKYNEELLQWE